MPETVTRPPALEEVLDALDAIGAPLRARILLELYYGGQACPRDLAGERIERDDQAARIPHPRGLGASLGTTAYHVRCLLAGRLIELAGERRVRGAIAHDYIITDAGVRAIEPLTRLEIADA